MMDQLTNHTTFGVQCIVCGGDQRYEIINWKVLVTPCTNCALRNTPSTLLNEAYRTVNHDRRDQYGAPEDEFTNITMMWSAITNATISAKQVALMMIALKLCRESFNHKHDNLVDVIGYTLCLERIVESNGPTQ